MVGVERLKYLHHLFFVVFLGHTDIYIFKHLKFCESIVSLLILNYLVVATHARIKEIRSVLLKSGVTLHHLRAGDVLA